MEDSSTGEASSENEESPGSVEKPSLDLIFEILKNSRRREAIRYLQERDEQISLGELAEHIAAIENETTVRQLTSSQRKRVYVGLYQCHLPKLDDVGVVDFNQDRGHVTLNDQVRFFEPYIDSGDDTKTRPWHRYYAGLSIAGVTAVLATALSSLPASVTLGVSIVIAVSVGVCALAQWSAESNDE